jgi:hypothetical protein
MKSLFGDDEPVKPIARPVEKQPIPDPVYTIDDRLQDLEDAIDVVAAYAISTPKERYKVIERAVKLIERLKKLYETRKGGKI